MNEFKTKLETLLNKEKLSMWDVGCLFKSIGEMFSEFENSVLADAECTMQDANTMLSNAKEIGAKLKIFYDTYDKISQELYEKTNEVISKHYSIHRNVIEKLSKLPKIEQNWLNVHQLKELCDLADRFTTLDDVSWKRVVELAETLSKR